MAIRCYARREREIPTEEPESFRMQMPESKTLPDLLKARK